MLHRIMVKTADINNNGNTSQVTNQDANSYPDNPQAISLWVELLQMKEEIDARTVVNYIG